MTIFNVLFLSNFENILINSVSHKSLSLFVCLSYFYFYDIIIYTFMDLLCPLLCILIAYINIYFSMQYFNS